MARPFPTNNAVTNAVAASTPIAFCMTVISCVEPDQTGPAILRPRALLGCENCHTASSSTAREGRHT
jgi:hypothetical protein